MSGIDAMETAQVRSRQRVAEYGEVYTDSREVNAMLDLVEAECKSPSATFLEPACGHGNFLAAILTRKLEEIERKYGKSRIEFERDAVTAIGSLYGVDKLSDNVRDTRKRLGGVVEDRYRKLFKSNVDSRLFDSVGYILDRNIIWGNALTLRLEKEEASGDTANGRPTLESLRNENPLIIFSEWKPIGNLVRRRDYHFEELINKTDGPLFSDRGEEVFSSKVLAEYKPVHYLEISHAYD